MTKAYALSCLVALILCFNLAGCFGKTTPDPSGSPTPSATEEPAETGKLDGSVEPGEATTNKNGTANSDNEAGEIDGILVEGKDPSLESASEMTQMNISPGADRYFQNTPNEAEVAYAREQGEKKRKAQAIAEEMRKDSLDSGNGAPVYNPGGGGEIVQVGR